ncbi:MAG TPA: hypothetical protein PLB97_10185 [Accumulibacter sp.]|jgi:hypothetical protein|nr:hypothetical protein [Accumulibacter sp.]
MIFGFFPRRPDHPLAHNKELKRIIGEIRRAPAVQAVEEVSSWLDSLKFADKFPVDRLFEIIGQLDDAAQTHIRRLKRDYLTATENSKIEEERQWSRCYTYFRTATEIYESCLQRAHADPKSKVSEAFKDGLPLLGARLQALRTNQLRWRAYRYASVDDQLWLALGRTFLAAESAGYAQKSFPLYTSQRSLTSVQHQYLHALIFHVSGMDGLTLQQIEMADQLIAYFMSGFVFSAENPSGGGFWVVPTTGVGPTRLVQHRLSPIAGIRYFWAAAAFKGIVQLIDTLEHGEMPSDFDFGEQTSSSQLLPVLRHLRMCWAPKPPQRRHVRHEVTARMAVINNFFEIHKIFVHALREIKHIPGVSNWSADNVSLGGFRACCDDKRSAILKLGSLVCTQAEGSQSQLLGTIRRISRRHDGRADLGVQVLARQVRGIHLQTRRSGISAANRIPGLWLPEDGGVGLKRIILPLGGFSVRETMEFHFSGETHQLTPLEIEERGADYEIARFRDSS